MKPAANSFINSIKFRSNMKVKLRGINNFEIARELSVINPDFLGFIFYERSPRNISLNEAEKIAKCIPAEIKKVGVFVNVNKNIIIETGFQCNLNYIQLHGDESPEFCERIRKKFKVIKAFSIGNEIDFKAIDSYKESCDIILLDTKSKIRGGSGMKFDWRLLEKFGIEIPFLLSGGIKPEDADDIVKISHPKLLGVDINSGFESKPGIK